MHNKGQVFTTDFLLAMTVLILGFGLVGAISEFNMYQNKERTNFAELQEKAQLTAITLANSTWADCNFGTTEVAYSINTDKLAALPAPQSTELKKRLGISDYNAMIIIGGTQVVSDDISGSGNIASIDLNVMVCNNTATFADLNSSMNGVFTGTKIRQSLLAVRVGK